MTNPWGIIRIFYRGEEPDLDQLFYVYDSDNLSESEIKNKMKEVQMMEKQNRMTYEKYGYPMSGWLMVWQWEWVFK